MYHINFVHTYMHYPRLIETVIDVTMVTYEVVR